MREPGRADEEHPQRRDLSPRHSRRTRPPLRLPLRGHGDGARPRNHRPDGQRPRPGAAPRLHRADRGVRARPPRAPADFPRLTVAADAQIAERFRLALEEAVRTGELHGVYSLLADDVEWVTPQRTFRGLDDVKWELRWVSATETFDYEFRNDDWENHEAGVFVCRVHEVYRLKRTGEVGYERDRRVELQVRDGLVARYEMRIVA